MIARAQANFNQPIVDLPIRGGTISALELGMAWFPEQPGGLDRYFYGLMNHLPVAGVKVHGIVCGSQAVQRESNGLVRAAAPSNTKMLSRFLAFRKCVQQNISQAKPDVIAAHFALYAWPILSQLKHKPLIMHFHGPWYAECKMEGAGRLSVWAKYQLEKTVYRRAKVLITLSQVFKNVLVDDFGIEPSRVHVIPGGVDLQRFDIQHTKAGAREQLGWPQDRTIVLTVRRLKKRMGLENLIDAAVTVKSKHPDALFLIAGAGQLSIELQSKITSLGLDTNVRLLGFLPDEHLPLAYRAANLSVVPSIALEGFGLVAVESLATGTPALVTPIGGLPEIVRPFRRELVTANSDSKSLAASLIAALNNLESLPSSQECRQYAGRYDWPAVTQAIRDVYMSVIS